MDDLKVCLDHIGLSGLEGCTLDELWGYASSADPPINLTDEIKEFIWNQIIHCNRLVSFYKLDSPKLPSQSITKIEIVHVAPKVREWYKYTPLHSFIPLNGQEGDVNRGSCSNYHTRTDVTVELTASLSENEQTLEKIHEKYGNGCLILVGSLELRSRSLFPGNSDPSHYQALTKLQYGLLEVIGQSRNWGIFRSIVTKNFLKIDARSSFHHVKTLTTAGLINIKVNQIGSHRIYMLFLKRFTPLDLYGINNEQRLCELLSVNKNHTLPSSYLKQVLKKPYKAVRRSLLSKGIIESIRLSKDENPDYPANATAIRLVGDYNSLSTMETSFEEEEDEEDDTEGANTETTPVVAELPMKTQAYQMIDSYGADGIANPKFSRSYKLDRYTCRLISRGLLASSSIVRIIMDNESVKTAKLISKRHSNQNKVVVDIQSQLAQQKFGLNIDDVVVTGKKATTVSQSKVTYQIRLRDNDSQKAQSSSQSPSSSLDPRSSSIEPPQSSSQQSHSGSQQPESNDTTATVPCINNDDVIDDVKPHPIEKESQDIFTNHPLTIRQLKRINMINQFMKEKRVENGHVGMMKHLKVQEANEGRTATIDRRTILKLLEYMIITNQLILKQRNIDLGGLQMEIKLYCASDATENEISQANKKAEDWYKKIVYRRETTHQRQLPPVNRIRKRKKNKKSYNIFEDEENEEENEVFDEMMNDERNNEEEDENKIQMEAKAIASMSKFQRIKHFHYYLWILVNGFGKVQDEMGVSDDDTPFSLPEIHYPWINAVSQLPSCEDGSISYGDILYNIPLSLFFMLKKIDDVIISKYSEYFTDAKLSNTKLPELPKRLRNIIANKQQDVFCIDKLIDELAEMKLIDRNKETSQIRSNFRVKLLTHVEILDTRSCLPRRNFFLEEARSMFKTILCSLSSLADLEQYWYKLHKVCIATPIIIGARSRSKKAKVVNDIHPLQYDQSVRFAAKSKEFNSRGFGAGGLTPLKFAHLPKNWVQSLPDFLTEGELVLGNFMKGKSRSDSYGPGMSLDKLPEVSLQSDQDGDSENPLPLSRKRSSSFLRHEAGSKRKKTVEPVITSSSAVKSFTGGKGLQRIRAKQVVREALKFRRLAKQQKAAKPSLQSLICNRINTAEDELALSRRVGERSCWFPHEDSFLLLGYIASRVSMLLNNSPVEVGLLRNKLHDQFETSKDKTSSSIHRRVSFILKKKNYSVAITACVEEVTQELKSTNNAETFESILAFILHKYNSHDGCLAMLNDTSLPSTIHELHRDYNLVGQTNDTHGLDLDPVSGTDQSAINQDLLNNLILMCLSADTQSYDAFAVFKQFEKYPEHDLKLAVEKLKSVFYIKSKKSSSIRQRGPLETQGFELSANFHQKLEHRYSSSYFKEIDEAGNMIRDWHDELGESQSCEPIRIIADDVTGGQVAVLISEVYNIHNTKEKQALCLPKFPEVLFVNSNKSELLESTLEEKDEEMEVEEGEGIKETTPINEMEVGEGINETTPINDDNINEEATSETTPIIINKGVEDIDSATPTDEGIAEATPTNVGEEEETGEPTPTREETPTARAGISTVLQVDEYADLQHGSVDFSPSFNIGKVLGPITEPGVVSLSGNDHFSVVMSLEQFCGLANTIGYEECDLVLAKNMYSLIQEAGKIGITEEDISTVLAASVTGNLTINDIIQDLLNFGIVHSVGTTVPVIVTHSNSHIWFLTDIDGNRLGGLYPWTSVSSGELNTDLLTKLEKRVVGHIITNPGITLKSLLITFEYILQKVNMLKLLKTLELDGQIKAYCMKVTPSNYRCTLFSSSQQYCVSGNYDYSTRPSLVYYEAVVAADTTTNSSSNV